MRQNDPVRRRMLVRSAIYTLAVLCLFALAYILMYIPLGMKVIGFGFLWLVGTVVILWRTWEKRAQPARPVQSREQLQKTILRRYQNSVLGSAVLYTLVLLLLAVMLYLIQRSRIWYETDPFFEVLKFLKDLSPFAGVALWVGGIAWLLYRQWRQSASDVVALIGSIEQMQAEQDGLVIDVPDSLPEVQPIVQSLYDKGQASRRMAKEAEQRKNELIAYLAHDLRTPLTSIIGYLSLLAEKPEMPAEQRAEYCLITLDKANRLEDLIGQFFEISRYNMSEMVLEEGRIDLKYLLYQLSDEFYPLLHARGKSITLETPDELWMVGDAGKLARVFGNIIRNAVAYGYANSPIRIAAAKQGGDVVVSVSNRGKTIADEQLHRLFGKFFRMDDARGSNEGGAGLGLAIAREIVLLHGGGITAQSAEDTITFTVTLPIKA